MVTFNNITRLQILQQCNIVQSIYDLSWNTFSPWARIGHRAPPPPPTTHPHQLFLSSDMSTT